MTDTDISALMSAAHQAARSSQLALAERHLLVALAIDPDHLDALQGAAQMASARGDLAKAAGHWQRLLALQPDEPRWRYTWAQALEQAGQLQQAEAGLGEFLRRQPQWPELWLYRAHLNDRLGLPLARLKALDQALSRAQRTGHWVSAATTPAPLQAAVQAAWAHWRQARREYLRDAFAELRASHGGAALKRVDHALAVYLGEVEDAPPDVRQRPKFLYFPHLDTPREPGPYHNPKRHAWAAALEAAYPDIRVEALEWLADPVGKEGFLSFGPGSDVNTYVGGDGAMPAWDALFFYRHGQRFDAAHARCPRTSAALDAAELVRIKGQTPEVCYSVLAPGTVIKPHYGVTNTRLVMHLPLIVPPDCALQVLGFEPKPWREGQLFMFDDSYEHQAWNHSSQTRVILLMDCWHPGLTEVERGALTTLVERITAFERIE